MKRIVTSAILLFIAVLTIIAPLQAENKPEHLEWLKDAGLGLFIHWSIDSQLGVVISHSLVGASGEYNKFIFEELPKTFNPTRFDADEWARLAKVAGFQYVVFTSKHHSGFCMWESDTTDFDIANTPYQKDIQAQIVDAFRIQGIKVGFYFSPDDFHVLWKQGTLISRKRHEALPQNNPGLREVNEKQVRELFTRFGKIDIFFIDGPGGEHTDGGLNELVWKLQPDCLITRGAIVTPEISASTGQSLPEKVLEEPWEANFTMGSSWAFKPTNEKYIDGKSWIQNLIETRAKGGTMLLNIGPEPNGLIPFEQERTLREIGAWMAINREAIYDVRPWATFSEGNIWYTKTKDEDTVYAFLTGKNWQWGTRRYITLTSVEASANTEVSVLGQNDKVLEYDLVTVPSTTWEQTEYGLVISAVRAQRIYNDREWPNPVVLKITNTKEPE